MSIDAYKFGATCPDCGGPLSTGATYDGHERRRWRDLVCEACRIRWRIEVTITLLRREPAPPPAPATQDHHPARDRVQQRV